MLEKEKERISNNKFKVKTAYLEGYPQTELIKFINNKKIDLVVVGSRGWGKWKGAILGSISQFLATSSNIPVLIIK